MYKTWKHLGALAFLILIANFRVAGQQGLITGKVVDSATGMPVEYVQILNYSLQTQIYSNLAGEFKLQAHEGDTLVMYAMGYFYKKVIVNDNMLGSAPVSFMLLQQPYNLSAANILGIGDYDDFRQRLISIETPKTKTDNLNEYLAGASVSVAKEAYEKAMSERKLNGISIASIPIYTPEELERIRLKEIVRKEQVKDQVYQKFNPGVVREITGLTDDSEIIEFMVYCDFSDSYLLEVSSYDLAAKIAAKFELFRKKKQDDNLMQDPMNFIDEFFMPFA